MVLSILALRGLAGFSGDKWVWLDHDADWIYPNGPSGHLHDVYFNQYDDLWSANDPKLVWHIDPAAGLKDLDTNYSAINDYVVNAEPWQAAVNGIY
mmetsp:Transcript_28952/g.60846  ORF Transcript_28952/g.60846 Transcript_28952/m.60846 type:complete len:96 (-) Transcript_28952:251-538(-)|eukprot:CAMPEP_0172162338 /NCGR_PEP_ID=MMETSP1050-20130122/6612_1 /TAXON_ID=233186 /ORGANISM="Cryptomonas curvata, Strain CCAP979/52" /LENGTH=95 /DNA_ID=CAMNT_0012832309 /DNA_START=7 /DNA_END=294 /DNA_ORIENTATION=-